MQIVYKWEGAEHPKWAIPTEFNTIHKCERSSPIQCCGSLRCESCHMGHMREAHTPIEKQRFWRFHSATNIIQQEERNKSTTTKLHSERSAAKVNLDSLNENDLKRLLSLLRKE